LALHIHDFESGRFFTVSVRPEYEFITPDGQTSEERAATSWGRATRQKFGARSALAVEIADIFDDQPKIKMLLLGAVVSIDCLVGNSPGPSVRAAERDCT
jgi:hypothetical protein